MHLVVHECPAAEAKDVEGDEGSRALDPAEKPTLTDCLEVRAPGIVESDELPVGRDSRSQSATSGNRSVRSMPLRLHTTARPLTWTMARKSSHFGSKAQRPSSGGRAPEVASIGSKSAPHSTGRL